MIDIQKKVYSVSLLCEVVGVSCSGYYAWCNRGKSNRTKKEYDRLLPMVKLAHSSSRGTYGARRISEELKLYGISCSRYKATTLMKLSGVCVKQKRKFKVTTDSKHNYPISPNLLGREFSVDKPNRVYASDITYIWTKEGWIYLTIILDLFSRRIVGWSLNNRIDKKLVMDALIMAVWRRHPSPGLIFHSDRGSQYCSTDFRKLLEKYKMISSMSKKGDCWDNAVSESFFGTLKNECVFYKSYNTRAEAKKMSLITSKCFTTVTDFTHIWAM